MSRPLGSGLLLVLTALQLVAQIQVSPFPVTNNFSVQPSSTQWSSRSQPGAAGDVTTTAQMDAQVQTNSALLVSTPLISDAGNPPPAMAIAVWSTNGYVQTRAGGNIGTLLMAKLQNNSTNDNGQLLINYDFTVLLPVAEQIAGHRTYFSLTGASNSWQISSSLSSGTSGSKSATLNLTNWTNGALLYVLWADDNGSGSPDTACQIDNFAVSFASGPAQIVTSPVSQAISPGGSASFSVLAAGLPTLFYQWQKNGETISGATNSTFTISNAQPSDVGGYSVVVTNALGSATSTVAMLTVEVQPLTITSQPQSTTILVGSNGTLTVGVNGATPAYQWFKRNTPITGATNAVLVFQPAQLSDTASYHVLVTNVLNSVTSQSAIVSVVPPPFVLLSLTNDLWRYNQDAVDLGTAWRELNYLPETNWSTGRGVFAVEDNAAITPLIRTVLSLTSTSGSTVVTYYFRKQFILTNEPGDVMLITSNLVDDGAAVYANGSEAYRVNLPPGPAAYGTLATNMTPEGVFFTNVIPGQLLRTGTNVLAVEVHQTSVGSSDVVMGLSAMVHYTPVTLLGITNQPQSKTTDELRPVTFTLGYTGTAARVQWFKETVGGPEAVPGANAATFTIPQPVQSVHGGTYFATISNAVAFVMSDAAVLTITQAPPTIVSHPQPQRLCPGMPLLLDVFAYGSAASTFQWLRNGSPIPDATNASYSITVTTTNNTGLYAAVVSNALGTATSSNAFVEVSTSPFILAQSDGEGAGVGATAQFTVVAGGCGPFSYQWQFNGTNLLGATNATLVMTNVQLSDEGLYRVLITNPYATIASAEAPLAVGVGTALNAPELNWTMPSGLWLVEGATSVDGVASLRSTGTSAFLETTVVGPGKVSFWTQLTGSSVSLRFRIDGRLELLWFAATPWGRWEFWIPAGSHVLSWESQGSPSLTNTIVFLDQITFSTNDLGPAILSAPQNIIVPAGSNFFFEVTANGFPPLAYQWQFNGSDLSGENQILLTRQNAQSVHAGNYTVIVSNEFGTATASATLTVTGAAPVIFSPARVSAVPERDVILNAQAFGSEPLAYQWRHDGTPIASATNQSLILPRGPTNWPGRYSVLVSNTFGAVIGPDIEVVIGRVSRVIQISMDGFAAKHFLNGFIKEPQRYPAFQRLMREGAFTLNARCDYTHSITVPNHLSMLLGRPVLQPSGQPATVHHGYTNNFSINGVTIHNGGNTNVSYFASVFDVVHDRGGSTALVVTKTSLYICSQSYDAANGALDLLPPDNGRGKIDFVTNRSTSAHALDSFLPRWQTNADTYAFLHFGETDSAGHSAGWGSLAWFNAMQELDTQLGRVMGAVETNASTEVTRETVIIVTADHGGEGASHLDPAAPLAYTIPVFVLGPGFSGGTDLYRLFANRSDPGADYVDYNTLWPPIRNGDLGNLALNLLGLPPIPGSTLTPMFPSDFIPLTASREDGSLILEWPAAGTGFVLEKSFAVDGSPWTTVTNGVTANANHFRVTIPLAEEGQFFRLKK